MIQIKQRNTCFSIWACCIIMIFSGFVQVAAEEKPADVIQKMEKQMQSDEPMRILFEETYQWTLTDEEVSLKGELVLLGDDQFRMTTDDQIMVSNGKKIWTYNPAANRVLIDKVSDTQELLLPKTILMHYTKNYRAVSLGEALVGDTKCQLLKFTATDEFQMVPEILVWVDDSYLPKRIRQKDANDNLRIFKILQFDVDESIQKSVFEFQIPDSAEVIKMY